jgi:peptidoglycan L-alanyl-D-glutamate endopeptidase CwlK
MSFSFGANSEKHLATCDERMIQIARLVMSWQIYDFSVVWGFRGADDQNEAFEAGNSGKEWPDSLHNRMPSPALDFAPYINGIGIPWKDTHAFAVIGGLFLAAGAELGYELDYGGDWDMDGQTTDQILQDWGHVQLRHP